MVDLHCIYHWTKLKSRPPHKSLDNPGWCSRRSELEASDTGLLREICVVGAADNVGCNTEIYIFYFHSPPPLPPGPWGRNVEIQALGEKYIEKKHPSVKNFFLIKAEQRKNDSPLWKMVRSGKSMTAEENIYPCCNTWPDRLTLMVTLPGAGFFSCCFSAICARFSSWSACNAVEIMHN